MGGRVRVNSTAAKNFKVFKAMADGTILVLQKANIGAQRPALALVLSSV